MINDYQELREIEEENEQRAVVTEYGEDKTRLIDNFRFFDRFLKEMHGGY